MKRNELSALLGLAGLVCACAGPVKHAAAPKTSWDHVGVGLTIPIPGGWAVRTFNGRQVLARKAVAGFSDNVNVLIVPHDGSAIEAQLAKTRGAIATLPGVTLHELAIASRAGERVLALEFYGRLPKQPHTLHIRSLSYVRGDKLVVVTATVLQSRWPRMQPTIVALLDAIKFR